MRSHRIIERAQILMKVFFRLARVDDKVDENSHHLLFDLLTFILVWLSIKKGRQYRMRKRQKQTKNFHFAKRTARFKMVLDGRRFVTVYSYFENTFSICTASSPKYCESENDREEFSQK